MTKMSSNILLKMVFEFLGTPPTRHGAPRARSKPANHDPMGAIEEPIFGHLLAVFGELMTIIFIMQLVTENVRINWKCN